MATKRDNITLILAIVGAVTGLIAFSMNVKEQIKYRPRVEMDFKIVDFARDKPRPQLVGVLIYKNLGKSKINVTRTPEILVNHPDGRQFGPYTMFPPKLDPAQMLISLDALGVRDQAYMIPDLEQDIASGELPDIRSRPDEFRFEVSITTTEGNFRQSFVGIDLVDSGLMSK